MNDHRKYSMKEKLETFKNVEIIDNSFLLVKVGSDDRPASLTDIEDTKKVFTEALSGKFPDLPILVWHHNIEVELHSSQHKRLQ